MARKQKECIKYYLETESLILLPFDLAHCLVNKFV